MMDMEGAPSGPQKGMIINDIGDRSYIVIDSTYISIYIFFLMCPISHSLPTKQVLQKTCPMISYFEAGHAGHAAVTPRDHVSRAAITSDAQWFRQGPLKSQ